MLFARRFTLMDAAGDGGGDGGAAGGGAGAPATAAPTPAPAATPTPTPAPAPSALAAGGAAAPELPDFIPEKYRVMKDDGAFDLDASARKLAEAHGHLEKRLGSGDAPPKDASEYTVAVPDQFKDAWKADDPQFKEFAAKAHEMGLSQKQFDFFMGNFFQLVPAAAQGANALDAEKTTAALKEVWKDDGEMKQKVTAAFNAADRIAKTMNLSFDDIEAAGLGNNPMFIRIMAKLAPEFKEDVPPSGGALLRSPADVKTMQSSEAYRDPKHPQHDATVRAVRAYYENQPGGSAVVI